MDLAVVSTNVIRVWPFFRSRFVRLGQTNRTKHNITFLATHPPPKLEQPRKENYKYKQMSQTDLQQACVSGHLDKLEAWLMGHDPKKNAKETAFALATLARHGHVACVARLLLWLKSDVDIVNACVPLTEPSFLPMASTSCSWPTDKATALYFASAVGHVAVVDCLLRHGAVHVNAGTTRTRVAPLSVACVRGHVAVVRTLLRQRDTRVDATTLWRTASGCLDAVARVPICAALLDDPRLVVVEDDEAVTTLVHVACQRHDVALLTLFLQHPKTKHLIHAVNDQGQTALYTAAGGPLDDAVVQCLLQHGAAAVNPTATSSTSTGHTPLHRAVTSARMRQVRLLLEYDGHGNNCINAQTTSTGRTPLMEACHEYWKSFADGGDMREIVQELLRHPRLDVNRMDHKGRTVLMHASAMGLTRMVELLLMQQQQQQHAPKTVYVHSSDKQGQTALHLACAGNHLPCVKLLVQHRACLVTPRNALGATPLDQALWQGDTALLYYVMREHNGWQQIEVR